MRSINIVSFFCAFAFLVSGCAPLYVKTQPNLDFRILDSRGEPLEKGEIVLKTITYPYGRTEKTETFHKNNEGIVHISSRREWQIAYFMPHGRKFYSWQWCAQAPGYNAEAGEVRDGLVSSPESREPLDASEVIAVNLSPSSNAASCKNDTLGEQ